MLKFRIIARMDIRNDHLIKTIRCEGVRTIGDPAEFIKRYDDDGIDELYFNDCVASLYGRNTIHSVVEYATANAFCPVTVAGGVRSEEDVRALLNAGADKIALNTAAIENPGLIDRLALRYGSSTIVLQLDAKRTDRGWEARTHGSRQGTWRDAIAWAREAVDRGAGEVVVTSVDREGTSQGPDIALAAALSGLPAPVVLAGGFRSPQAILDAYGAGISGVAIAGALHYRTWTAGGIKRELSALGVPVRLQNSTELVNIPSLVQANSND